MDKLSYFDTLANLIPGIVALWGISVLFPGVYASQSALFSSPILGPIVYVSIALVVGNLVQFLSKITVEPLLRLTFWHRHLFSEIFLVESFGRLTSAGHSLFVAAAANRLGFARAALAPLSNDTPRAHSAPKTTLALSHAIYRVADAVTQDEGLAVKAHTQNVFYSLYRNLALVLFAGAFATVARPLTPNNLSPAFWLLPATQLAASIAFFLRTRDKGEAYVKGLFWSLAGSKGTKSDRSGA